MSKKSAFLITITACLVQSAFAAPPDFDILGFKLGMSEDEVVSKLKSIPNLVSKGKYQATEGGRAREFVYEYCFGTPEGGKLPNGRPMGCDKNNIIFAFAPKTKKLWGILRMDNYPFEGSNMMPLQNIKSALESKFGTPPTSKSEKNVTFGGWELNENGISDKACSGNIVSYLAENFSNTKLNPKCGTSFAYSISTPFDPKFATRFTTILKSDKIGIEGFRIVDAEIENTKKSNENSSLKNSIVPKL